MRKLYKLLLPLLCLFFNSEAQQLTQTLRGQVIDKNLQTPVPGAIIQLLPEELNINAISDSNGFYRLDGVPVGRQYIRISFLGYKESLIPNITVSSGKESIINVHMDEEVITSDEVVVTANKNSTQANNHLVQSSVTNLRTEDINRFAGARSDPSRMAASYAGVSGGGDQRNDIIVRGNSPTGVLWRLEGVDIPNPNHFTFTGNTGGAFSILNNNLMANSDFLTGAFPAEYGNKTAAVFDVRLRNGNNQKRENTFQLGLNGIEFGTEGPVSKKSGSSYLVSYRFLSFEALSKMGIGFGVNGIPQFQDATVKLNFPTKKAGTFTLWSIGGSSKIYIKDKAVPKAGELNPVIFDDDDFKSSMFASGASHTYNFSKNTSGKLILSTSASKIDVKSLEEYQDHTKLQIYDHTNTEGQHLANYTLSHKINSRHFVKTGVIYRSIYYKLLEQYEENKQMVEGLNDKANAGLLQTFAHWQYRISDKMISNAGLYYQNFMLNNTQSLEPRASVGYEINDRQKVTIAAGLHSQTQSLYLYDYKFFDSTTSRYSQPNKNVGLTKALHFVAGYQKTIKENLRFKAEVYYQHLYNIPVSNSRQANFAVFSTVNTGSDYNFYVADSLNNSGTGRNYGLELTLERSFSHNIYFLTNLSLLDSKYNNADGIQRNTAFNIGHVFNVLAGKEFHLDNQNKRYISVDMKLTHSGGRRIIDVNQEESIRQDKPVYNYQTAYQTQLPSYFRTDLKVSYNVNKAKSTHNIFIAADNVFNTQNILTRYWDNAEKVIKNEYQLGLFPYLGYKVQF